MFIVYVPRITEGYQAALLILAGFAYNSGRLVSDGTTIPHLPSLFSWPTQACSHSKAKGAKNKPHCSSPFQASTCITSANSPLVKVSHMVKDTITSPSVGWHCNTLGQALGVDIGKGKELGP